MDLPAVPNGVFVFGRFRLDPVRRRLLRDAMPITLPPRLFDTLHYLLAHSNRVVSREELLRVVWAGRVVEDANIKQTIFSLRRALKDHGGDENCIVTVPLSGYRFAGPVDFDTRIADQPSGATPPTETSLGRHQRPMRPLGLGLGLVILATLGAVAAWRTGSPPPPPHSLAVLAFTNLTGDDRQEYFSDGISAELISALSRLDGMQVAASRSSFAFKGKTAAIGEIARQLHVGAVLEGTVRRAGTHMRIDVDLVNAETGYTMWSQDYDRDESDILSVQQDIASSVANTLRITLLGDGTAILIVGGTHDQHAFDSYLRGMAALSRAGDATAAAQAALTAFDEALAFDPKFALAHAHRAHALTTLATSGTITGTAEVDRMMAEARAESDQAISIAPGLAGGHLARGTLLLDSLDFTEAEREISLAHQLAPGDATVLMNYAYLQIAFGHVAAGLASARQAALLDPLTPITYIQLSADLIAAGDYDGAETALHRANILGAGSATTALAADIALRRGDFNSAARDCMARNSTADLICRAIAEHALGNAQNAVALLAALQARLGDDGAYQYAEILAQFGQVREAFTWLRRAVTLRDPGLILVKSDVLLKPLRGNAEYQEIVRGLHFPS